MRARRLALHAIVLGAVLAGHAGRAVAQPAQAAPAPAQPEPQQQTDPTGQAAPAEGGAKPEAPDDRLFAPHPPLALWQGAAAEQAQAEQAAAAPAAAGTTRYVIDGYLSASVGLRYRPDAVPRDRYQIGSLGTAAGILVQGAPYEHFRYMIHVGFAALSQPGFNIYVDEADIAYSPFEGLSFKVGHMRVPFSISQVALVTTLMFPTRAGPTEVFQSGADDGIQAALTVLDERVRASIGAYNGSSLGLFDPFFTRVAPVLSAFLDVQPFGTLPAIEADSRHGPFRLGLSCGGLLTRGNVYDAAGYKASTFQDLRMNAAVRAAFRGLFLQGEYLRRLETNDLAGRPSTATGLYGETTYFLLFGDSFGLAPMARIGRSRIDEAFAPRETVEFEAGFGIYPRADLADPSSLRVILEYTNERRVTENETAHGAIANVQLVW